MLLIKFDFEYFPTHKENISKNKLNLQHSTLQEIRCLLTMHLIIKEIKLFTATLGIKNQESHDTGTSLGLCSPIHTIFITWLSI